jgi:hypothetical protein
MADIQSVGPFPRIQAMIAVISRRRSSLLGAAALAALVLGCRGDPTTLLTRIEESRRIAAELHVRFSQAADASNRAVMAGTDDTSIAAAQQAELANQGVDANVAALARLVASLSYAPEAQLLREFAVRFAQYRQLDRRILALAVENTNLKAQALSFGPARHAASDFREALGRFAATVSAKDRCPVDRLVADALESVRDIQLLHAPHIAERDEAAMTRMEREMDESDAKARAALSTLGELAPSEASGSTPAELAETLARLDELKGITGKIVALSRRNSNVLSLDLALRNKPPLVAACEESLRALREALAKEGPKVDR